jgi:hypothetical protein
MTAESFLDKQRMGRDEYLRRCGSTGEPLKGRKFEFSIIVYEPRRSNTASPQDGQSGQGSRTCIDTNEGLGDATISLCRREPYLPCSVSGHASWLGDLGNN